MNRLPAWAFLVFGAIAAALAVMGLVYSVHTSAKIFYSVLLVAAVASLLTGYRRRPQRVRA